MLDRIMFNRQCTRIIDKNSQEITLNCRWCGAKYHDNLLQCVALVPQKWWQKNNFSRHSVVKEEWVLLTAFIFSLQLVELLDLHCKCKSITDCSCYLQWQLHAHIFCNSKLEVNLLWAQWCNSSRFWNDSMRNSHLLENEKCHQNLFWMNIFILS